jgi:hypothetical protein
VHRYEIMLLAAPLARNEWWRTLLVFALFVAAVALIVLTIVGTVVGVVLLVKTLSKH